jgi:hypothetical protein
MNLANAESERLLMETAEILEKARDIDEAPHDWIILPLLRDKVTLAIIGWVFGAIVALGIFAFLASIMIPHNYQIGPFAALVSTILLGIMLFAGLGSIWQLVVDVGRLLHADKHLIIITPDDFVKQEGKKITHVPLMYVRYITARGSPSRSRTSSNERASAQASDENTPGFQFWRGLIPGMRRRRKRTPTALAFIDSRTDAEVIVASDATYGDPFTIADLLKEYATNVQRLA